MTSLPYRPSLLALLIMPFSAANAENHHGKYQPEACLNVRVYSPYGDVDETKRVWWARLGGPTQEDTHPAVYGGAIFGESGRRRDRVSVTLDCWSPEKWSLYISGHGRDFVEIFGPPESHTAGFNVHLRSGMVVTATACDPSESDDQQIEPQPSGI